MASPLNSKFPTVTIQKVAIGGICVLIFLVAAICIAQKSSGKTVVLNEPGRYDVRGLYNTADIVALVKIQSGDVERYDSAVYKGKIVEGFKGASAGESLYFGPYVGLKLGWQYVLFLHKLADPLAPKDPALPGYGTIQYAKIFNEGYSSLETSYECVFDDKGSNRKCDDGVRICTDYLKLPEKIPVFPPMSVNTPFGCRWVRRTEFLSMLRALKQKSAA